MKLSLFTCIIVIPMAAVLVAYGTTAFAYKTVNRLNSQTRTVEPIVEPLSSLGAAAIRYTTSSSINVGVADDGNRTFFIFDKVFYTAKCPTGTTLTIEKYETETGKRLY